MIASVQSVIRYLFTKGVSDMYSFQHFVSGAIDNETRCSHYYSEKDRIAIKFYCCGTYYSCYTCHAELGCGHASVWPKELFKEKAILCGACGTETSIVDYLGNHEACMTCKKWFNPGCSFHAHLYFEQ